MDQEAIIAIVITAVTTLMGGGLLGAIFTGMSTRAGIKKTGADALETYQKIANIATESLLASQLREKEAEARTENIINKLEEEAKIRIEENTKLKHIIVHGLWGYRCLIINWRLWNKLQDGNQSYTIWIF